MPQYEQQRKKGLPLPKKGIFTFSCIYDPIYSRETDRIVTRENEARKIVPRKDDIISFFSMLSKVRVRANFFLELDGTTLE